MGKKDSGVVHTWVKRSLWDSRITAACGFTAAKGTYKTVGIFDTSPPCPACKKAK